ncbi:ABC transporter ATP-binding protein [Saccharibacillus kuerlensis]|uniref:ABC transporter n=1 Tax=Saccharibacillus kuerlensis TaxID=459527 RepID=A0ABQ2L3E0_9BACL|nr:ABC transporter ATP-binding protein [Saccharibacillus kuerlensis]GGO01125.1 ABC transporter [Saccharibacillus kuerlensis]
MNTILSVRHLSKEIKGRSIVKDISFDVLEGEIVGLLGANGAGKTTIMKMIVGLSKISAGDVWIAGNSMKTQFSKALDNLGAVIEAPAFYPYLRGYENLRQYQRLHKNTSKDWLLEVANLVGIDHALKQRVGTYSLGMKQRLGIAQALLKKPKLLVLDEPLNGLDPAGVRETRNYLSKIASELGVSALISSHQLSEIEQMASRVIVIQEGSLMIEQQIGYEAGDGGLQLTLHVNDLEKTSKVLAEFLGEHYHSLTNQQAEELPGGLYAVFLTLEEEQVPRLIRTLCSEGVDVHRVQPVNSSLEEKFLQWTTKRGEVS